MSRPERLVVGVVMAAALMGTPRTAVAQLQLDVMTFNIRTSNVSDGDNGWPHRKKLVAETIRRYAPQVVGLQEAVDEQIEFLTAALPDYRWLGIDRGLNGGQGLSEYTPIFYRHAEMTPIESGNFWLSETPDVPPVPRGESGRRGCGGRIVTWARFHHLTTGQAVYVFNTHFTLRRGQRQLDSVRLILERVGALPPRSAVVVMGDFNNVGESDVWRVATGDGLRDVWVVADERRGPALTLSDFGPPGDAVAERVDWILVGGPIGVTSVETVLHNDGGRYPSDHYPVAARLEID